MAVFTPREYHGKPLVGKLVVQTEEMQWSYEVRGTHPKYVPPASSTSGAAAATAAAATDGGAGTGAGAGAGTSSRLPAVQQQTPQSRSALRQGQGSAVRPAPAGSPLATGGSASSRLPQLQTPGRG